MSHPRHSPVSHPHLHYIEEGTGPVVVLLHGFPQYSYSWRHQMTMLAAAGIRVVAPDLRGYNLSEKPSGVESYRLEHLVDDVAGLIRSLSVGAVVLGGHDWGGFIAWGVAMRYPDLVDRLVILNAPHPAVWRGEIRRPRQMLRSIYVLFFQIPALPERALRAFDWWAIRRIFRNDPLRTGTFTPGDIERYCRALERPGALTAAINYYRAAVRFPSWTNAASVREIDIPVLQIWGRSDRYLGIDLARRVIEWAPRTRTVYLDASHWVHEELPEETGSLLIDFIKGSL